MCWNTERPIYQIVLCIPYSSQRAEVPVDVFTDPPAFSLIAPRGADLAAAFASASGALEGNAAAFASVSDHALSARNMKSPIS